MAGSISIKRNIYDRRIRTMILLCTSDASGDVSGNPIPVPGGTFYNFGYIPVSGASDLWDIVIPMTYPLDDGNSISLADILNGDGANLSNSTNGGWVSLTNPCVAIENSIVTPTISNLGNAQSVYLLLHFWEEAYF